VQEALNNGGTGGDVSGKLDKVTTETELPQAYIKNADGSQGLVNIRNSGSIPTTDELVTGKVISSELDSLAGAIGLQLEGKLDKQSAPEGQIQAYVATYNSQIMLDIKDDPNEFLDSEGTGLVTERVIKRAIDMKQDKLTAGDNITIDENGVISATGGGTGGTVNTDDELSETSVNPVQNKVITKELNELKQDKMDNMDIDISPSEDSDSLIYSKGVYSAVKTVLEDSQSYTDYKVQEALSNIEGGGSADKVDMLTGNNLIYATDKDGYQSPLTYDYDWMSHGNVPIRDTETGEISVPETPLSDYSATSKKYVDDLIDELRTEIENIKATLKSLTGDES
jgi:hypothetical protein